jgi:hypothetical protein
MKVADCAYQIEDGIATPVVGPFKSGVHLEAAPLDALTNIS